MNWFDELTFRDRFCMYKEDVLEILTLLESILSSMSHRGGPVPSSLQVLIALRFLASGTFHCETGDLCGVSEATACRIVHNVCSAICELRNQYIMVPDAAEQL